MYITLLFILLALSASAAQQCLDQTKKETTPPGDYAASIPLDFPYLKSKEERYQQNLFEEQRYQQTIGQNRP